MEPFPRTPGWVVAVSVTATVLVALPSSLIGALGVVMRADLEFDTAQLGAIAAAFFAASAAAAWLNGRFEIAARLGLRASMLIGVAATMLTMAFIAGLAADWVQVAAAAAVGGLANGIVQPAANVALARRGPKGRLGFTLGIKQAAVPVATLLAGVAVSLIVVLGDWRIPWWIGVGLAGGFVVAGVVLAPRASLRAFRRGTAGTQARGPRQRMSGVLLRATIAMVLGMIGANAMKVFFIEAAVARGESITVAGVMLTIASIAGVVTRLIGGWRSDRTPRSPYTSAAVLVFGGSIGTLLMAFASGWPLLLLAALLGIAAGWGWSGLVQFGAMRAGTDTPGAAGSYVHFGGLVGNLLGPLLFGTLSAFSMAAAWIVVSVVSTAGGVLLLVDAKRVNPRTAEGSGDAD